MSGIQKIGQLYQERLFSLCTIFCFAFLASPFLFFPILVLILLLFLIRKLKEFFLIRKLKEFFLIRKPTQFFFLHSRHLSFYRSFLDLSFDRHIQDLEFLFSLNHTAFGLFIFLREVIPRRDVDSLLPPKSTLFFFSTFPFIAPASLRFIFHRSWPCVKLISLLLCVKHFELGPSWLSFIVISDRRVLDFFGIRLSF